ncbi:MAG: adenylate kinase [Chlamydiae bacterium]|nr:adenylate kinase [Chlamydiota bacterium]
MNKSLKTNVFIFFGPPGSGKGEQAKRLSENFDIPHISSGTLLRQESDKGTELGKYFNELIKNGNFPADEHIVTIIKNRIVQPDCTEGFILDGFPRTLNQVYILEKLLSSTHSFTFINITINEDVLTTRLMGRRICSSCTRTYHISFLPPKVDDVCDTCSTRLVARNDDRKEVICKRLEIFNKKFEPILEHYKNYLNWVEVESKGTPEQCFESLIKQLESKIIQPISR